MGGNVMFQTVDECLETYKVALREYVAWDYAKRAEYGNNFLRVPAVAAIEGIILRYQLEARAKTIGLSDEERVAIEAPYMENRFMH